jgi:hypothetical protein
VREIFFLNEARSFISLLFFLWGPPFSQVKDSLITSLERVVITLAAH